MVANASSFAATIILTLVPKYCFDVQRPDGTSHNSFPSGHTATAFMSAHILHKEYGHISPWVSVGAYTVATGVGAMRIMNNRHWTSDVLVGAALGILGTELGYWLSNKIIK